MEKPFEIDRETFDRAMASFDEISTKNPEDYTIRNVNGEDDYEDCPYMFNYPDFSQ